MSGDYFFSKVNSRWAEDTQGTTSAVATKAAETGETHVVVGISGSSDAASVISVESPSGTVLWRGRCTAGGSYAMTFPPGCLMGASGAAVLVRTATGTSACEANLVGFTVRG